MNVVVVESPAKAKTINKYLGDGYTVLASYGHVRDLPPKDGSVDPDNNFEMLWNVDSGGEKRLKDIAKAVKGSDHLFLATDPDREGEAISWHIQEELTRRKALKDVTVERVVFNEITKSAIQKAFEAPRAVDAPLVHAYLARRALDYLVGFNLSPVLWRKLPGSRSAGRVQSVCLRLICEREAEIEVFKPQEYWSIEATITTDKNEVFTARLTQFDGEKIDRLTVSDEPRASAIKAMLESASSFAISSLEKKQAKRNPAPPFTTSTLQQEASRKLGFGASQTMRVAQKLYEGFEIGGETVGLITYMRTDGVTLSGEAIGSARDLIGTDYGSNYVPGSPRVYKSKAKNAQEAHEAIRPTDMFKRPGDIAKYLDSDQKRLYELIWKRTIASQMESAVMDQVVADVAVDGGKAMLRANGSTIRFDGFLKLYLESKDDSDDDDGDRRLPPLEQGQSVNRQKIDANQHFTQPPPRYTEASLVKKMEELGIGRPSTYASIIQVLQDREYVTIDKKRFIPADRGRVVTAFLAEFFKRYVEYDFTADMEGQLDDISDGRADWQEVLTKFWESFKAAIDETKELRITQVIDSLDEALGPHFFPRPVREDGSEGPDPRICPKCSEGRLGLRLGKTGGFIGCSSYPECKYTRPLGVVDEETTAQLNEVGDGNMGSDPKTGLDVFMKEGPYGWYVQLGEPDEEGNKPKRASLPKGTSPTDVDLARALSLLALPRLLGQHEGVDVTAGLGRFGPFVKKDKTYASIPKDEDVLTIGLNRAVTLIAEKKPRGAPKGVELGKHPADEEPITIHDGKYGPYVKHGKLNASLPKDVEKDALTIEQAVELLAKQAEKKGKKAPAKKPAAKKAPAKKATDKKPAAKKPAAKKAPAKKKAAEEDAGEA